MSKRQPYFPNNWDALAKIPSQYFDSCTWKDFKEYKLCSWELPSSVACVVRVRNDKTTKVEEFAYRRLHAAEDKIFKLIQNPDNEVTVVDHDSVQMFRAKSFEWGDEGSDEDDLPTD